MHKATKYQQARHKTNFTWLWNYLLEHPCTVCTERDPLVLEFHHTADDKTACVSSMMWNAGLDTLKTEVAKCDVVCANCHKRLHSSRVEHADLYGLIVPADSRNTRRIRSKPRLPKLRGMKEPKTSPLPRQHFIAEEAKAWMTADKFGTD